MAKRTINPPPKKTVAIRLEYLRAQKRRRKMQLTAVVTVILAAVLFYITGLYGTSIALLGDAMDTIAIVLQPRKGWPEKTAMNSIFDAQPVQGGFLVLGENDLALYSDYGNSLRKIQHGFARPAISVGSTRFCLYSRTGSELRIENRSRTLYTKNFEQPIVAAEMGKDNSVGVLTRSARYTGELILYNREFEEIFHWYATEKEGTPYLLSFTQNTNRAAVGCLAPNQGVMGLNIQLLDTTKDKPLNLVSLGNCKGYRLEWISDNTLLVITDQFCVLLDDKGKEKARYTYDGRTLLTADTVGKNTALLFKDGTLVLLNEKLKVSAQKLSPKTKKVVATNKRAYTIQDNVVEEFSWSGELIGTQELQGKVSTLLQAKDMMVFYSGTIDVLKISKQEEKES